jgi:hypothetical protein
MEEPCVCRCGEVFELGDGYESREGNTVICVKCSNEEDEEAEREEEISDLLNALEEAESTVKHCKDELKKLGYKIPEKEEVSP